MVANLDIGGGNREGVKLPADVAFQSFLLEVDLDSLKPTAE